MSDFEALAISGCINQSLFKDISVRKNTPHHINSTSEGEHESQRGITD